MLIKYITEDYLQKNDDVSCVTEVMGIPGPLFINQERISDIPAFLQHSVEEAAT